MSDDFFAFSKVIHFLSFFCSSCEVTDSAFILPCNWSCPCDNAERQEGSHRAKALAALAALAAAWGSVLLSAQYPQGLANHSYTFQPEKKHNNHNNHPTLQLPSDVPQGHLAYLTPSVPAIGPSGNARPLALLILWEAFQIGGHPWKWPLLALWATKHKRVVFIMPEGIMAPNGVSNRWTQRLISAWPWPWPLTFSKGSMPQTAVSLTSTWTWLNTTHTHTQKQKYFLFNSGFHWQTDCLAILAQAGIFSQLSALPLPGSFQLNRAVGTAVHEASTLEMNLVAMPTGKVVTHNNSW